MSKYQKHRKFIKSLNNVLYIRIEVVFPIQVLNCSPFSIFESIDCQISLHHLHQISRQLTVFIGTAVEDAPAMTDPFVAVASF